MAQKEYCPYCMNPVQPGEACPACGLTAGAYTPSPHHLPPGTVLRERYLIGRVLGEGGFGITYLGCDLRLELKVAIKEYFPTDRANRVSAASCSVSSYAGAAGSGYEAGKERFLQEARRMARMDKQPVIVSVRDFFEENNTAYIVMEYVEGTTFKDLVAQKGGRIPAGELLHCIEPLFSALGAMHALGLIHRDISPENLMLEHGEVRLLDFGCAREDAGGEATMTIALKHGYAPVEQYQNKGQGPWSDVYALSATIYYCLTGRKPPQSMDRLVEDELVLPRKLGVELTERQERALLHGMEVRPRRRFQTVEELHAALYEGEDWPADSAASASPKGAEPPAPEADGSPEPARTDDPEPARTGSPKPNPKQETKTQEPPARPAAAQWLRGHLPLAIGGAAALVLAAGVLGYALNRQPAAPAPSSAAPVSAFSAAEGGDDAADEVNWNSAVALQTPDPAVLLELLADDSVPAVRIPGGFAFSVEEPLTLTKPLRIEEGASLNLARAVTLTGAGAVRVEGQLSAESLVRTVSGGGIEVAAAGRMDGGGILWLAREEDLAIEQGGRVELLGVDWAEAHTRSAQYLVLDEDALFAGARQVRTMEEWNEAVEQEQPVVIAADLTLSEGSGHQVPVLIPEGVTVTMEGRASWCVDGAILVNRGTLRGGVVADVWSRGEGSSPSLLLNYGLLEGAFHLSSQGALLNYGQWNVLQCQVLPGFVLYNAGEILHGSPEGTALPAWIFEGVDHLFMDIACNAFLNEGEVTVQGGASGRAEMRLAHGIYCTNTGSITVGRDALLQNDSGELRNCGALRAEGGQLINTGLLRSDLPGASLIVEGAESQNVGLLLYARQSSLELPEGFTRYGGRQVCFSWTDDPSQTNARHAATAEELADALADEGCERVYLPDGAQITFDGPLTVEKPLLIPYTAGLTVNGGLTLAGENALLYADCPLAVSGGLVLEGGVAYLGQPLEAAGLTVEPQGFACLRAGVQREGISVQLNGGHLLWLGWGSLRQGSVSAGDGGVLRVGGELVLESTRLELAPQGEFLVGNSDFILDAGSSLINRGEVLLTGWSWQRQVLEGTVENYGRFEASDCVQFAGSFANEGRLTLYGNAGTEPNPVSGRLENRGEVLAEGGRLRAEEGGQITGVPDALLG